MTAQRTAFVTGASGFIAKHVVKGLVDAGYAVRAGIRSRARQAELEELFPGRLAYASVDLDDDRGWADALAGADVLLHTASPYPTGVPKDPDDLIRPALAGTRRVLAAAHTAGVQRVVLTSSCAAIYKDSAKARGAASTRENWTDPDGPDTSAYEKSKTLAERAAWEFAAEHPEMRLTTVNPGVVLGPPLDDRYGTSLGYVEQYLSGRAPGIPRMELPVVDVTDVARLHVGAIADDRTVGRRYPANAGVLTLAEIVATLRGAYPDRRIPRRLTPDWMVRLSARMQPDYGPIAHNLGRNLDVDGSDGPRDLGFAYIPSRQAVLRAAEFLVAHSA